MEEEVGIKVTRLRRRLSVESEDVKSPSTQSTPTKKRGGRLAAKPQLELIDENATEAAPKRTRKSTAKEIAEPIEEKVVTPSRRSTRIRSNTSIVSETPTEAEDKGTPSRRSTRIKSNTSIVAETAQNVNSPRAKRAARRTSLAGSDNEAPSTPARQTRRTRKDSASSVDKPAESNSGKLGAQLTEVIVEESEKATDDPKSDLLNLEKSPRMVKMPDRKSSEPENKDRQNQPENDKTKIEKSNNSDGSESQIDQMNEATEQKAPEKSNISISSSNLINEIDEVPKVRKNMNKSTTSINEPLSKPKRNRTKSWTTISVEPCNDNSFCSDSEASRKKKKNNTVNFSNISGSGDGIMNISNKNDQENEDLEESKMSLNSSTISNKKKKKRNENSIIVDTEMSENEKSVFNTSVKLNKSAPQISVAKELSKGVHEELEDLNTSIKHESSATEKLFEKAPSGLIQSIVFIEDSDSNNGSSVKQNKNLDSGDQCVPVVHHPVPDETSNEPKDNMSYEPMDIDETMPRNVSLSPFMEKNNSLKQEYKEPELEKRKSISHNFEAKDDCINNSKRKSKISDVISDDTMDSSNKSQRKSSITVIADVECSTDKHSNKTKRKSSISNVSSEDTTDGISNIFIPKSLLEDANSSIDIKSNKSKRKSSIANIVIEDNADEYSNKSSSKSNLVLEKTINDSHSISPRKCSITEFDNGENMDKSLNKPKRTSSTSAMLAEVNIDKRNSSMADMGSDDNIVNKSSNKSKSKSSISNKADDSIDKKSNNAKRKSSVSFMESQTENENKSTLVLSQIKDATENEINVESNVTKDNNEQLSKSVNIPNVNTEKETDKKNMSLTYSTSTPLQQKSFKKLGMQINSSIITPNSVSELEKNNTLNSSKKVTSIISQDDNSDSSENEEDSKEESSMEKSKIIDDEAEEASDDYESGDSRDEEEKEYEEQNEIVEKGETLDSDDEEYSDDSDYEKGSFIVSSDEEDNDLLSGSGDDLSMSADELSMSTKAKKKYNERKKKEQKKASREMFEARHQLNENKSTKSDKPKAKKNNRQRLDSSSSESEDELIAEKKKNRRQRINSSQDVSTVQSDSDKSLSKKKKKVKRLSESLCDDNEKEITVCEENHTDNIDPLELRNAIKEEPKTPQKDLNISTVAVTNMAEVEEVNVDENISIMKSSQTSDPLQASIAQDDAEDNEDEESISENEEITQNFESVLIDLNKANSKKIKAIDISLNLDKKSKPKSKEPIVDQLNLTQIKKSKKKKADTSENIMESKKINKDLSNKNTNKINEQTNPFSAGSSDSSDSIDMKLLFPEDSNDSEVPEKANVSGNKQGTSKKGVVPDGPEDFIPLKRTEGKTNILANMDIASKSKNESTLNVSNKKQNKRKSFQTEETMNKNDQESENVSFFIDTTGTLDTKKNEMNTSIKNSAKKNKQKKNVSVDAQEANLDEDLSNDAPLEMSYRSEKNKSKQDLNTTLNTNNTQDSVANENESSKKNKKNKEKLNNSQKLMELSLIENREYVAEKLVNISTTTEDGSAKKKKKKISESQTERETENGSLLEPAQNVSQGGAEKEKTTSESSAIEKENVIKDDTNIVSNKEVSKKRKRKSSAHQTVEVTEKDGVKENTAIILNESLSTNNQKKKRKISHNDEDVQNKIKDTMSETQTQEKINFKNDTQKNETLEVPQFKEMDRENTKKRKERDDDDATKISKVLKQYSFDKVYVPRLPANVLNQLQDKPKTEITVKRKQNVISTTSFVVEETKKRRNKPSNYLEESVYLNDDLEIRKQRGSIKNPKVLPFIPTASTSDHGFTTNFRVNIIPQETQFVAQSNDKSNFKNEYLHKKRIKKLGTFEMYKRQRNIKISKF